MDRLIREEEKHLDTGIVQTLSHRYDLMSRRIATVDTNGNETQYSYDAFGRVIKSPIQPCRMNI